jgi:hypothetical protein
LKAVAGSDVSRGFKSRLLRQRVESSVMATDIPGGQPADRTVYRWPRARLVRMLGRIVIGLGLGWILVTVLVVWLDLEGAAWFGAMAVVSLLTLAAAGVVFARPPVVLELTDSGYRLHNLRAGGTRAASWADVRSVSTGDSVAGPVLVIEGRHEPSVVPLTLLGPQATDALQRIGGLLEARQPRR